MKKSKVIIEMIVSFLSSLLFLCGLIWFNKYKLMGYPLGARLILRIVMYWSIVFIPIIFCIKNKCKLCDLGFSKDKLLKQVLIGFVIAFLMSLFLTFIPMLIFGKESISSEVGYKHVWEYIYLFVYYIISVSFSEEFLFRCYLLSRFKKICNSSIVPILATSLLFGLFHIFNGNVLQVIVTSFIGLILVLCREKIKDCSLLSLIIAHGIYDWLILFLSAVL